MLKDRLKEVVLDQKESFSSKRHLIRRDIEINKYINTQQIVIISGVRRCGKSSLMYLIKDEMNLKDEDYCYFNFDDERIIPETSILEEIYNLHIEIYGTKPILFLDEIQNIPLWEKFVNRMYEQGIKIFVSGSNAKLMSSEISSSLTGRNKLLELFPFSFSEYLTFKKHAVNIDHLSSKSRALLIKEFNNYMEIGGFPLVVKENDPELVSAYFQDILYRDIVARYRLTQVNELKQIGLYFASNVGKIFSYSTLQKISGIKSNSSIKDYLYYYEQTYLFFYLKKFDFSVKKQIMNSKKVYTIDTAFAKRLGFNFSDNKGRILENIVFLELLRRNKEIYYFSGNNECDFLVKEGMKITMAIQVSYNLHQENFQREYKGLMEAMEKFNLDFGLIIANQVDKNIKLPEDDKVKVIPIWKWLIVNGEQ